MHLVGAVFTNLHGCQESGISLGMKEAGPIDRRSAGARPPRGTAYFPIGPVSLDDLQGSMARAVMTMTSVMEATCMSSSQQFVMEGMPPSVFLFLHNVTAPSIPQE